jgi:hypothetical protein
MEFLYGPLTFVFDVAPANQAWGVVATILLAGCIAAWPVKPRVWTAVISFLGILAWLFFDVIGVGIDV